MVLRGAARRAAELLLLLCGLAAPAGGLVLEAVPSGRAEAEHLTLAEDHANQSRQPLLDASLPANVSGLGSKLPARVQQRTPLGAQASATVARDITMTQVFMLCTVMYGTIGVLWLAFWRVPEEHSSKQPARVALLCMSWASMSIGMQVLNKTLVMTLGAPALISVGQMWIAVVLVGVAFRQKLREAPAHQLRFWLVVPLFFAAMLCTSFYTYQYISLSFYAVISNLAPFVVLPIERLTMPAEKRPRLSPAVVVSIGVMLAGAVAYGGGVGRVSAVGCTFALANMLLAVGDRVIQRRLLTSECNGLAPAVCTVMNNALGSIPAMLLAGLTHQFNVVGERRAAWTDPRMGVLFLMSGGIGIGICYLGFECQRAISATSFVVMQNASKVVVIICGTIFFQDPIKSPLAATGLVLSIGGSFSYGKAQMALQQEALALQKEKEKLTQAEACDQTTAAAPKTASV